MVLVQYQLDGFVMLELVSNLIVRNYSTYIGPRVSLFNGFVRADLVMSFSKGDGFGLDETVNKLHFLQHCVRAVLGSDTLDVRSRNC